MTLDAHVRATRNIIQIADLASVDPVNGMEVGIWIPGSASLDTDDRVWYFRYRATNPDGSANSNTNKWEWSGGVPTYVADETTTSFSPGGANDWVTGGGTPGPDLRAPIQGIYQVDFGATINAAFDANTCQIGLSNGSGNDPISAATCSSANVNITTCERTVQLTIAANARLRMEYRDAHNGGTASYAHRWIRLLPVRVG